MTHFTLLHNLLRRVSGAAFTVDYAGERSEVYGDGPAQFALTLHDPSLSNFLIGDPALAFGEAYMDGQIDVKGDLADLVALAIRNASLGSSAPGLLRTAAAKTAGVSRRSQTHQRADVTHHYDIGNDFFALWLDRSMTYSCAYFHTPDDSLEQAQTQKLDHSLRKLRLKLGERLLDIGCGWGSMVIRATETHGVYALGITLSEEQRRMAEQAVCERCLDQRAEVRTIHYEALAKQRETFDKIVSIGMIEHVGKPHLSSFANAVHDLLRPGGLALLHLITCPQAGPLNAWSDKYIFPGGYLPSLPEIAGHLTNAGFRIWDMENLGPHYRLTLDRWSERFERCVEEVRQRYGERFVRMWRLYLRGCSACFREGSLAVHQILVSRGNPDTFPLTREDLYG